MSPVVTAIEVIDDYRVLDLVGPGVTTNVYRVADDAGNVLALKRLKWAFAANAQLVREFSEEAAILHRYLHPAIVRGGSLGLDRAGRPYYLMELAGTDLASELARRTPLSTLLGYLADIASALDFLHCEHRLAHGDLKATNVLLVGEEQQVVAKLADFGLLHELPSGAGLLSNDAWAESDEAALANLIFASIIGRPPEHFTELIPLLIESLAPAVRKLLSDLVYPRESSRAVSATEMIADVSEVLHCEFNSSHPFPLALEGRP
jgi:serine/threonine protein kinase